MPNSPQHPFQDLRKANAPYLAELKEAACRVIESGCYIGGEEVEAFEAELAQRLGVPFMVGVGNGLDALRLTLRGYMALGRLKPGQEVIVPANTYVATVLAVADCGLKPVFVDANPDTMNMDTALIEKALTPATGAVMPVHLYGRVCWDAALADLARRNGLLVVEDNAQAIGAVSSVPGLYGTHAAGSLGDAAGISFYPTKNLGALGDGGAVATRDGELAKAVKALRNYGKDESGTSILRGFNSRLDPIQAAMLRVKLRWLDQENAHRRAQANLYDERIDNPLVIKPKKPIDAASHVWHQYVVCVSSREAFRCHLLQRGIASAVHYPCAPHKQPCFSEYSRISMPVAERLADEVVSLPLHGADVEAVAAAVNSFAG